MVWVVTDPFTVSDDDRYSSETHVQQLTRVRDIVAVRRKLRRTP